MTITTAVSRDIQDLKANWRNDPIWDIENTNGFEDDYDELKAWRETYELGAKDAYRNVLRMLDETSSLGELAALFNLLKKWTEYRDAPRRSSAPGQNSRAPSCRRCSAA